MGSVWVCSWLWPTGDPDHQPDQEPDGSTTDPGSLHGKGSHGFAFLEALEAA